MRAGIQASDEAASVLAERFEYLERHKPIQCSIYPTRDQTVSNWRHRESGHDRSHAPHRLQTTRTPAQKAVAVVLCTTRLMSLDDLPADAIGLETMVPSMARGGSS